MATFSTEVRSACSNAILDLIDAGSGAGAIKLYTDDDVLLAEIPLDDPAGTVDEDGLLTLAIDGTDTALATGICTYATVSDSDDNVLVTLPVQEGEEAVSGYLVINSESIFQGVTVSILSATIG